MVSTVLILIVLFCSGVISCQTPGADTGNDTTPPTQTGGKGTVSGIVTDEEVHLSPGVKPQMYSGVSIRIHQAVEAGTSRQCSTCPELTNYNVGDRVTEVQSDNDGKWQVELPAGMYFIRASYGERSYSGDIVVEIRSGATTEVTLKLFHGI